MAVPFKIAIENSEIDLLKAKLSLARFSDELNEAGWEYGVPLADLKRLVGYWKDGYDWRQEEERINDSLPQFTQDIEVDGHGILNIHFVHQPSAVRGAIPLLIIHGCKSIEFVFFGTIYLLCSTVHRARSLPRSIKNPTSPH
jgi:Epoxide hydrolase N terminus